MRYKLTTQDMKTRAGESNEVTWEVGKWVEATGDIGNGLCSDAYIHWYEGSPELALLLNPIHANIKKPRCWEVECGGEEAMDHGLKGGSRRVRLVREVPVPEITMEHRVRFAILCAKETCDDPAWNRWADKWLSGEDRSNRAAWDAESAAWAAIEAAESTAWSTAWSAAEAAESAAGAAAEAAESAAWAARGAAESAAWDAESTAWSAAGAAAWAAIEAAESTAWSAAGARATIDLVAIAQKAICGD